MSDVDMQMAQGGYVDDVDFRKFFQALNDARSFLAGGTLAFAAVSFGLVSFVTPRYTAQAIFIPPPQQQSAAASVIQSMGSLSGLMGNASGIKSPADQYASLMQTATIQDKLVSQYKLMDVYRVEVKSDARKALNKNTRIAVGKKDGLITIEVDDVDPKRAAAITNSYIAELGVLVNKLALTDAQQRRQFYEQQLAQSKNRLVAAQSALQGSGLGAGLMRTAPQAAVEEYATLRAKITAAEVRLHALSMYATPASSEYKTALSNLSALRASLAHIESGEGAAPSNNYIENYREYKYQETLFELLAKQLEVARLDESKEGNTLQIVDPAAEPELPSKPRKLATTVMGTFGGLGCLVIFVLLRNALRGGGQRRPIA